MKPDPQATPEPPRTLGDVLYGNRPQPLVLESEWVELVRRVASGDSAALHALYERAHHVVFALAARVTESSESASQVTLEVFEEVWRTASQYDPRNDTVLGWIMSRARARSLERSRFDDQLRHATAQEGSAP